MATEPMEAVVAGLAGAHTSLVNAIAQRDRKREASEEAERDLHWAESMVREARTEWEKAVAAANEVTAEDKTHRPLHAMVS